MGADRLLTFDPQAFGVGALEDDDEDIYHRDSMSRYDTVLEGEEPGDGLYGWTAPQQYTNKTGGKEADVCARSEPSRTWRTSGLRVRRDLCLQAGAETRRTSGRSWKASRWPKARWRTRR